MSLLPHITLDTGASPLHSIIWMHGLGADGEDFVPVAEDMCLPVAVRFIFPHAPMMPVTINGGYVMRAWYDIAGTNIAARQDEGGIRASRLAIEALVEREKQRGVAAENIYLAGFSQGGAIALYTGLLHAQHLGGILALSTYLPLEKTLPDETGEGAERLPIFMAHGRDDTVVPVELGLASARKLNEMGYRPEWHEYAMQHSVCMEEVRDIEAWLTRRLNTSV